MEIHIHNSSCHSFNAAARYASPPICPLCPSLSLCVSCAKGARFNAFLQLKKRKRDLGAGCGVGAVGIEDRLVGVGALHGFAAGEGVGAVGVGGGGA